jgi:spore coat protein H
MTLNLTFVRQSGFWLILIVVLLSACTKPDSESINIYHIYCNEDDFRDIYENWQVEKYITADLNFEGKTYKNLKMRLRGDTSKELPKKSLKLKASAESNLPNDKTALNLNAEYTDKSMIRSATSSKMFHKSGHPCFKTQFAKVYLNDRFLGLYLEVENMDEEFLKRNNFDPAGNLFKATRDGACMSVFDQVEEKWENKTSKKNGFSHLKQLIYEVNSVDDKDFYLFVQQNFDYVSLINLLAMNMYLANGSTYYHNYYLFHDSGKSGKWYVFPWDLDKTLYYYHWKPYVYHETSSDWESDNALVERCFLNEQIMLDIKERLSVLSEKIFTESEINKIINPLATIIEPILLDDTTHQIKSINEWKKQLDKEKTFLLNHKNELFSQMESYPKPFKLHPVTGTVISKTTLCWQPSKVVGSEKLTYTVRYGNHFLLPDSSSVKIENITDTCLLISNLEPNKTYYWRVSAHAGDLITDGFNTKSIFRTAKGTELKGTIIQDLTLTQKNSPYVVEGIFTIAKGAFLRAHPGAEILFKPKSGLLIKGGLVFEGTKEMPIQMHPQNYGDYWEDIVFENPDSIVLMKHVVLREGRISASNAEITIENCDFSIDKKPLTFNDAEEPVRWSWIWINDCVINFNHNQMKSNNTGEGLNFFNSTCNIQYNRISNAPDAIELIGCKNSRITGNVVINSSDDSIDMNNCHFVVVESNVLLNTTDKAISIGSEQYGFSENIEVKYNYIQGAKDGIGLKDSSFATISNNIFTQCKTGIRLYQKAGKYTAGGFATCTDNAFLDCQKQHTIDSYSMVKGNIGFELDEDCTLKQLNTIDLHLSAKCFSEESNASALNWNPLIGVAVTYQENDSFCGISITNRMPVSVSLGGHKILQSSKILFTFPEFQLLPQNSTMWVGKCKKGCDEFGVLYYRVPNLCEQGDEAVHLVKVID